MAKIRTIRNRVLAGIVFVFAFFRVPGLTMFGTAQQSGSQSSTAGLSIGPIVNQSTTSTSATPSATEKVVCVFAEVPPEPDCGSCSCSCSCGCGCSCSCTC